MQKKYFLKLCKISIILLLFLVCANCIFAMEFDHEFSSSDVDSEFGEIPAEGISYFDENARFCTSFKFAFVIEATNVGLSQEYNDSLPPIVRRPLSTNINYKVNGEELHSYSFKSILHSFEGDVPHDFKFKEKIVISVPEEGYYNITTQISSTKTKEFYIPSPDEFPSQCSKETVELTEPVDRKVVSSSSDEEVSQEAQQISIVSLTKCRSDKECTDMGRVCLPDSFWLRLFGMARCCPIGSKFENGECIVTPGVVSENFNEEGFLAFPLYPIDDFKISSGWRYPDNSTHGAIDYSPYNKSKEYEVYAAASGEVIAVENSISENYGTCSHSYGSYIKIRSINPNSDESYDIIYAHLKGGSIKFNNLDDVMAGDKIGTLGNTGCSEAAHLHFEIREDGSSTKRRDPYDIYSEEKSDYPEVKNEYNKSCGDDYLWKVCPPINEICKING